MIAPAVTGPAPRSGRFARSPVILIWLKVVRPGIAYCERLARHIAAHRGRFMDELEQLLEKYPALPVGMMHMGQLEAPEVRRLIERHPNIFFMTSTANSVITPLALRNDPNRGWINMFEGWTLKREWRELLIAHPSRFVLAFDNVFKSQWGRLYLEQIDLWRRALAQLPAQVAHAGKRRRPPP